MSNNKDNYSVVKNVDLKKAVVSISIAILFIVLIMVSDYFLFSETRRRIIAEGELTAVEYAAKIDDCLIPGISALQISAQTMTEGIRENVGTDALIYYLQAGTKSIMEEAVTNTTGLYACIDGTYLDGAGWVPEEGYDPLTRPWYIEAVKNPGSVTVVEPYLDVMSNSIIITLAKCLEDSHNVVALDLFMDDIQRITESMAHDDGTTVMVLCEHGTVVAHSDASELGKNYFEERSGLGSIIIGKVFSEKEEFFELHSNGKDSIIYAVPMQNGWYSISVIDSARAYQPLRILRAVSIFFSIVIIVVLIVILIRSIKVDYVARRLNQQLLSSADIYMSLCDLDVINNSITKIKEANSDISAELINNHNNMQETITDIMQRLPENPTKQSAIDFVDLSDIDERFSDQMVLTLEYLSFGNKWVRARFVISERTSDGRISHVLWMLEDIDREKKDRDILVNMSEKAIAANEAKSSFLSNMSHEIRTPITAILGMNEMINRECDDQVILGYSENIKNAGNTLLGIINDILDFSKIEAGKLEVIPAEYSLASMLNSLVNMIRGRAVNKDLEFITEFDPEIPSILYGDEVRIKQIIINILTNAIKYTKKGHVTFIADYERIADDPENIILHIRVEDTGIGIKQKDLSRLFLEFERIDEKKNRGIEGTGLGMSITRSLLSMMESKLEVQSVYGEGSVFEFRLKQKVIRWDPVGDYNNAALKASSENDRYKERFTAPGACVLIIDDNAVNLVVFESLLKETLVQVDTACSGEKGLELSRENRYDLIFMDHMMPGMDGIETLSAMKNSEDDQNHDTPVICLTANAISGAKERYLEAGFNDYLTKPIDPKVLEDMMIKYLPEEKIKMESKKTTEI